MLNPNQEWPNEATFKARKSSLAVTTPAAYGPYLQESRLDIRRNSHNPLAENNNFPDLQQQRPFSAHSFPSLSPQQNMLQQEQQNELLQQQKGQQQMQPLSSRKLFIGGLGQIDDNTLRQYYSQWGQVVDCIVIRDPTTRSSRGFGFVTYTTAEMADVAIAHRPHIINGKAVDAKRAVPREKMNPIVKTDALPEFLSLELVPDCRLQLSNLNWEWHTLDTMRAHFEQFGPVEQLEMVAFPRGYGFLSFETQSAVERCLAFGYEQIVNGHPVDIKLATLDSLTFDTFTRNSQNAATMTDNINGFDDGDKYADSAESIAVLTATEKLSSSRPQSSASSSLFGGSEDNNFDFKRDVEEILNKNNNSCIIINQEKEEKNNNKLLTNLNKITKNEGTGPKTIILRNEEFNEEDDEN